MHGRGRAVESADDLRMMRADCFSTHEEMVVARPMLELQAGLRELAGQERAMASRPVFGSCDQACAWCSM